MVAWSQVTREDLLRAIREHDELGQYAFLDKHGFVPPRAYLLIFNGRAYDSKAVLGVAYKNATGLAIGSHDFSGGKFGAAGVLLGLGFEIKNVRGPR